MPGRNGTGPMGTGSMTGKGLGSCIGTNAVKYGAGRGLGLGMGLACRRGFKGGFGRGLFAKQLFSKATKDMLLEQKNLLEK